MFLFRSVEILSKFSDFDVQIIFLGFFIMDLDALEGILSFQTIFEGSICVKR